VIDGGHKTSSAHSPQLARFLFFLNIIPFLRFEYRRHDSMPVARFEENKKLSTH